MNTRVSARRFAAVLATSTVVAFLCTGPAHAGVISTTPTLPLLGVPYASSASAGCFAAAGVCVSSGTFTMTSVVSSTFNMSGQDIVTDVSYVGALTTLSSAPIGTVQLSGTVEQEVLGRTFSTETGTWTTDLVGLSLSGPLLGHTLTMTLGGTQTSSGQTSIVPVGDNTYSIDSFFDVFVDLTLDSNPPLHTSVGPIQVTAMPPTAVPEPASVALFVLPMFALALARGRRAAAADLTA